MKFPGKVGNGLMNKWLDLGGDPDHWSGYGSGWIQILIATLVRRAVAEVCAVPALLVYINYCSIHSVLLTKLLFNTCFSLVVHYFWHLLTTYQYKSSFTWEWQDSYTYGRVVRVCTLVIEKKRRTKSSVSRDKMTEENTWNLQNAQHAERSNMTVSACSKNSQWWT